MGIVMKVLMFLPNLLKAVKAIGVVGDLRDLVKEGKDVAEDLRDFLKTLEDQQIKAKHLKAELDQFTEKAADVCAKIPGLKDGEQWLRDLIK